jgi:hypothetical protein
MVSPSFPGWLLDLDRLAGFAGLEHPPQDGLPFVTIEVDEVNPAIVMHASELAQSLDQPCSPRMSGVVVTP